MKKTICKIMYIGVIFGLLLDVVPIWALVKDETIYAKLNNSGQVKNVVISEHLEGVNEGETKDKTKLIKIKNINGDEEFVQEDSKLIWKTKGKDIYYQGQTKDKLPIELDVSYYLNGKESDVKDMIGKKGNVKLVLKYKNNDKHLVKVNGKNETLYTPFVIATTTIIPNIDNKNIKVINGKVVTNGTNSVVVGLSIPGLYESLNIEKLKGLDTIEITYETEKFELNSIYAVATPKIVEAEDLKMLNDIDKVYDSINLLSSSSKKLKNGSGQLLEGANKLKDGINKLTNGIESAYLGSKKITYLVGNSLESLKNDNSPAIDNNTLNYIKENAVNSTKDVAINGARDKVLATFTNEYKNLIGNQAVNALQQNNTYNELKNKKEQLEQAGIPNLIGICSQNEIDEQYIEVCASNQTHITQYTMLKEMITLMEETARNTAISTAMQVALQTAEQTAETVSVNVSSQVAENVAKQVANSAKETAKNKTIDSLKPLYDGLNELTSGLNEINSNMSLLNNGTKSLKDGIYALDNGILQFNSQGINKITNLVNGDLKSLEGKVKALGELSNNYQTFDERAEGVKGSTKIIMVIDSIKANTNTNVKIEKIDEKSESLWDKIKGLFK